MTMFQNVLKISSVFSRSGFATFAATTKKWTPFGNQVGVGAAGGMLTLTPPSPLLCFEQKRFYWGHEGRIGWRRKRAKEMREREKILNPSSPVIDYRVPWPKDELPPDFLEEEVEDFQNLQKETNFRRNSILDQINGQLINNAEGRMFAVVHLSGKQFKVTPEDIIIVQGTFAPNIGDQVRLHKVLLVGSKDFTLIGRPLIEKDLARIEATVIEKTLSYTKMNFIMKAKKNFRRLRFHKTPYTMLRINLIDIMEPLSAISSEPFQEEHQKFIL
ncbi:39S ribosomal protein L21, mitochondrial [Orchesella cincta]|uniref:Large ribosomal subunit protein bL21m n=1 Tax=Orchesella cincta TaxID=48709 RepID=A0A1D2MD31_ORCCI|nr:39S ribosomal protein L21, mitochondrial [Orchesella cincta]